MYIKIGDDKYDNVRYVHLSNGNTYYTGASIPALTEPPTTITAYANNGFRLRTDVPGDYSRAVYKGGAIQLINEELSKAKAIPDERLYPDEIETAIAEGVNSI